MIVVVPSRVSASPAGVRTERDAYGRHGGSDDRADRVWSVHQALRLRVSGGWSDLTS